VKNDVFGIPLLSSFAVHLLALLIGSVLIHNNSLSRQDFLPIGLVDVPRPETPPKKIDALPEIKKPTPPPPKVEKPKQPVSVAKPEPQVAINEEPAKSIETKPLAPTKPDPTPSIASGTRIDGGGSEAGAGNLFGKGDIAVVPGSGTAGGGGGTASSGLGRGSGAPGPSAQTVLRTNRLAKAIQSVRPIYPPLALKMGMEGEVALKIIVDPEGNVSRAEIVRSGGADFDEEALKAVRQSRFEPAQRDGQNVPAEFTYIYRFRLQR
jgi:protein TonB